MKSFEKDIQRIKKLEDHIILDTLPEKDFDQITTLLAAICDVPMAFLSFIDRDKQWFKSKVGSTLGEPPRDIAFCEYTIQHETLFIVEDTLADIRFAEHVLVKQDPKIRFYAGIPLVTPDGVVVGSLCILDIKPRILGDKERLTLETLADQVMKLLELRVQNRRMTEAKESAEKALLAKAQFLSVMSHELRTPLNGILGIAHWLTGDHKKGERLEMIEALRFSAENLLGLINNILDYNKMEAGKLTLEKIDFEVIKTVNQIVKSFRPGAAKRNIELNVLLHEEIPQVVVGDQLRLTQVLTNLIGNALKFTEEGEVKVEVIPLMETDNFITLEFKVLDTGIGIAKDKLDVIFDGFMQASAEISRRFGGSGLGLAITKNLVHMMGGEIHVKSTKGKGSIFAFELTYEKSNLIAGDFEEEVSDLNNKIEKALFNARVLVVDDNHINRFVTSKFLEEWGIRPDFAVDGREAVEKASRTQYDLILMDLQMPELDGFEATRIIRKSGEHNKKVPIIALTASAVLQIKDEAFKVGVSDYLMKPFKQEKLHKLLLNYLSHTLIMNKSNTIENKVDQVADGDKDFKKELVGLYIQSFQTILEELNAGRFFDLDYLKRARHKHKSTLKMLDLDQLDDALLELQTTIEGTNKDEEKINETVLQIHELGQGVIKELEAINL